MRRSVIFLAALLFPGCGGPPSAGDFVGLWSSDRHSLSNFIELSLSKNGEFDCVERVQEQSKPAPDLYRHGTWTIERGKLHLKAKTLAAIYDGVGYISKIEASTSTAELWTGSEAETLFARWPLLGPPQPKAHDIKLMRTSKSPKPLDWDKLRQKVIALKGKSIAAK